MTEDLIILSIYLLVGHILVGANCCNFKKSEKMSIEGVLQLESEYDFLNEILNDLIEKVPVLSQKSEKRMGNNKGVFLTEPNTKKISYSGYGDGLRYGASSMQGWRATMEDENTALVGLPKMVKDNALAWFGVFDGHAGCLTAKNVERELLGCIQNTQHFNKYIQQEFEISQEEFSQGILKEICKGFLVLDAKLHQLDEHCKDISGSTAICVLITHNYIVMANCGDSRGVYCIEGNPVLATVDHKPNNVKEKARILEAGGFVQAGRVNGTLAMSRALGDFEYKKAKGKEVTEQMVSPEPDIFVNRIDTGNQFIVLACDGIWDVMNNLEMCQEVSSRLKVTKNLETIAEDILNMCLQKGSMDNMTIIIITLDRLPKSDIEVTS